MVVDASERGLSRAEADVRLARDGPNELVPRARRGPAVVRWIVAALLDPMVLLLLVAAPIYALLGARRDAIVTALAVVPITAVGLVLELRAERALEALARMASPAARVRRDGEDAVIPAAGVVLGDCVLLSEGDVVPADADLVAGSPMLLDESALTGESLPVAKEPGADRALYAGTVVLSGRGRAVVSAVGARTRYGRIGALLANTRPGPTPLQRATGRLVRWIAAGAAVVCAGVVAIGLVQGRSLADAAIAGVSLAIAAVPEEFPMVLTLFLALGGWRLARQRALVRNLPGVETLGSTTVICSDKTGTLTTGALEVAGVAVDGVIVRRDAGGSARALLEAAVLASEPDPLDPLDRAIVRFAAANGVDVDALHADVLLRDHPFEASRRLVTHVWRTPAGLRTCAKGAMETVLDACRADDAARGRAEAAYAALAGEGMRVIAVAAGPADEAGNRAADEARLALLGLVAFADPPRPGVEAALARCQEAGVRIVMLTGDHPLTAHAIANELGIPHDDADPVVTGDEIDAAPDSPRLARATIFARVRPEQKHSIIQAFKRQGHVVAMTGDGVNDAPALREADIGVAMGRRGTEVARQAATLVLLDDEFSTIVAAIAEGRRIFASLRTAFGYLLAFHVPLVAAALIVPLLGYPLLLMPVHLLLLELVVHPTVALVFEHDPPAPDLMQRPPRRPDEGLLGAGSWRTLLIGATLAAVTVGADAALLHAGLAEDRARSFAFAVLVAGQCAMVLTERSPDRPAWRSDLTGNPVLWPILAGTLAVLVLVTVVPVLARAMHGAPLGPGELASAVGIGLAATLSTEVLKAIRPGGSGR